MLDPGNERLRLVAVVLVGATAYAWRSKIVLRADVAVLAAVAFVVAFPTRLAPIASAVLLPYLVLWFAYQGPPSIRRLTAVGDVSYGIYIYAWPIQQAVIYIYAWPIQQAVIATTGTTNQFTVILIALPIAWLAALVSWRLIERPALRLKPRRANETVPSVALAPLSP